MNPDAAKLWVGRTFRSFHKMGPVQRQADSKVVEFLAFGNTYAVFHVSSDDGEHVIKVPNTHIAFTIHLPPRKFFPELEADPSYEQSLIDRLIALQGSPALSRVYPLDKLWTALAVQHLSGVDKSEQSITLEDYEALGSSEFVIERLTDWAAADAGRTGSELHDVVVIYEYENPIHATLPQILAQEAAEALEALNDAPTTIRNNPYLPWLAAGASGFGIPSAAPDLVAAALKERSDVDKCFKQASEVLRYTAKPGSVSWDEMLELGHFVINSAQKADGRHRGMDLLSFLSRNR